MTLYNNYDRHYDDDYGYDSDKENWEPCEEVLWPSPPHSDPQTDSDNDSMRVQFQDYVLTTPQLNERRENNNRDLTTSLNYNISIMGDRPEQDREEDTATNRPMPSLVTLHDISEEEEITIKEEPILTIEEERMEEEEEGAYGLKIDKVESLATQGGGEKRKQPLGEPDMVMGAISEYVDMTCKASPAITTEGRRGLVYGTGNYIVEGAGPSPTGPGKWVKGHIQVAGPGYRPATLRELIAQALDSVSEKVQFMIPAPKEGNVGKAFDWFRLRFPECNLLSVGLILGTHGEMTGNSWKFDFIPLPGRKYDNRSLECCRDSLGNMIRYLGNKTFQRAKVVTLTRNVAFRAYKKTHCIGTRGGEAERGYYWQVTLTNISCSFCSPEACESCKWKQRELARQQENQKKQEEKKKGGK